MNAHVEKPSIFFLVIPDPDSFYVSKFSRAVKLSPLLSIVHKQIKYLYAANHWPRLITQIKFLYACHVQ